MSEDQQPHNVAITVLTTVEADDYTDAVFIATKAVKVALGTRGTWNAKAPYLTITTETLRDGKVHDVQIHAIEPLDQSLLNGRCYVVMAAPRVPERDDR